jgi:zinc finger protein
MNRRVVKSEYATIKMPDLDLEIPPQTQKGKLTTIEGFIANTKDNIEKTLQEGYYNELGEETISKIKNFLDKLENALNQKAFPFHFTLDDPSGNSFVENPYAPSSDPYSSITHYIRTTEQLKVS